MTTDRDPVDLAGDLYALVVYLHADSNRDLMDMMGREELTVRQIKLLGILRSGRLRPTIAQVSRLLGMHPTGASRLVHSLARRGLVQREGAEEDGRRKRIAITDRGDQVLARLHAARYDRVVEFVDDLDTGQRSELSSILGPIAGRQDIRVFRPAEDVAA